MVKKKKNRRHQQKPLSINGGESTESCDENQMNNSGGKSCQHINKAVDLSKVRKRLREVGIVKECAECAKLSADTNGAGENEKSFWLCLRCGHQACHRHALKHYQTPRSDSHPIAVNIEHWNVWCSECDCEVAAQCRGKLHECIEFIKHHEDMPVKRNENETICNGDEVEPECKKSPTNFKDSKLGIKTNNLPRVRGLANIGNTCFFNAVLQCLAHTPFLLPVLQEMSESGTKFRLPGQTTENCDLPALEGELCKWRSLTEILASTLIELQSSNCGTLNPSRLLNKLIQCCPQFGGGEQHDSHELLRHLLEGVRSEDLKRYHSAILHIFGLSEKCDPNNVDDEIRAKARAYGRQAAEMMLHPEQVFRGFLVSTIECQDCLNSSQCVESFLDLSLPVMADKVTRQPPMLRRKTNNDEIFDLNGVATECPPSKRKLRKDRKLARLEQRTRCAAERDQSTTTSINGPIKNSIESEQSDADVEDNVDPDAGSKGNSVDIGESGYSSEKLGNDDSTMESPVSQLMNGDSVLTSLADLDNPASLVSLEVAIPVFHHTSPLGSPSPVSPNMQSGSPSSASSEVNIDCSSSISTRGQGGCASPDLNRPVSRFEFCQDEDSGEGVAKYSLGEDDLCEDMSKLTVEKTPTKLEKHGKTDWSATVAPRYQCEDGECSIQSCLSQFTALELMTGNNKVSCENCTRRQNHGKEGKTVCTNSTKQLLVKTPPAILILHLKRFQVHRSMFRKITRRVSFPLVLDLAPICSAMYKDSLLLKQGQNQVLYALYGVVEHSGTLHSGHYVAYVKVRAPVKDNDPRWTFLPSDSQRAVDKEEDLAEGGSVEAPPGKWYFVSDSRVNEVGEERVLQSQAYLLFYERIW